MRQPEIVVVSLWFFVRLLVLWTERDQYKLSCSCALPVYTPDDVSKFVAQLELVVVVSHIQLREAFVAFTRNRVFPHPMAFPVPATLVVATGSCGIYQQ